LVANLKIIKIDLKAGVVTLRVDDETDLWHLQNVIERHDKVCSVTIRNVFIQRDGRKVKIGRKPMRLTIQVERVEQHKHANILRITGKIVKGPEDVKIGSFHTIEVKPGNVLTIMKEWKKYQIERLRKAEKKFPPVLLVVVDHNEATLAIVKNSKVEVVSEVINPYSLHEEKQEEFYKKVATEIVKHSSNTKGIVLAGPGNVKKNVFNVIKEKYPEITKKIILEYSSSATKAGINELLKRGVLFKIVKESRIQEETKMIKDFFERLAKNDDLVTYGLDAVKEAVKLGAVDTILVSDVMMKNSEIEALCSEVEQFGGNVEVISTTHEMGERFNRIGGIGAFLRFKIK